MKRNQSRVKKHREQSNQRKVKRYREKSNQSRVKRQSEKSNMIKRNGLSQDIVKLKDVKFVQYD